MPLSLIRFSKAAALMLACAIAAACPIGAELAHAENAKHTQAIKYPWAGTDDEIVVNLAIGSLRDSMVKWLTTDRGVHAETLLVSIGAVAGFAAQAAALERIKKRDVPGVTKDMTGPELSKYLGEKGLAVLVTAKSGEQFYFGDLINGYLVHQVTTVDYHLFGILAAAAIESGAKADDLPDAIPMFRHASQTVGSPEFGILHPPAPLSPHLTPRQALDLFWPRVKYIFERTDGQGVPPAVGRNVKAEYWSLVTTLVARQFLLMAKDTIAPRTAMALVLESAIVMSKVDPARVPQTIPDQK